MKKKFLTLFIRLHFDPIASVLGWVEETDRSGLLFSGIMNGADLDFCLFPYLIYNIHTHGQTGWLALLYLLITNSLSLSSFLHSLCVFCNGSHPSSTQTTDNTHPFIFCSPIAQAQNNVISHYVKILICEKEKFRIQENNNHDFTLILQRAIGV